MKISDIRVALYVLILSIENDLRSFIKRDILCNLPGLGFLFNPALTKKIIERFKQDFQGLDPEEYQDDIVDYLDFQDSYEVLMNFQNHLNPAGLKELKSYSKTIEKIAQVRNRVMHSRPLMANDFSEVLVFSQEVTHSNKLGWNACSSTLKQLEEDSSFLFNVTIPTIDDQTTIYHNLPMPDFDETGFIGRTEDVIELTRLLLGKNSVITLVGEGGIGKTALMLKAIYDVIDMGEKCPFDYIVWVSSKTTTLTPTGIADIHNAICDFDSVIANIGNTLGNPTLPITKQILEIINAVKEVPTLIVLDNFETIVSEDIRHFIYDVQEHAKIAITSRIGLRELEFRRELGPMQEREGETLLRHLARVRNAQILSKMPSAQIANYIRELHYNPLGIKWFVQGVASGSTPGELINNKDVLLDYCMSNVYVNMSDIEKKILQCMLCVRRPVYEAELVFFSDIAPLLVRQALNGLVATSFVMRRFSKKAETGECVFDASPTAREFLVRKYPPAEKAVKAIQERRKQLQAAYEQNTTAADRNSYSINVVTIRNSGEQVSAKMLQKALNLCRRHDYSGALELAEHVIQSAPSYFEGYRISSFIKTLQRNFMGADEDFKKAFELEPNNPRLNYFYGGFFLRYLDDNEEAIKYSKRACELDPEAEMPKFQYATCLGYMGRHSDAINILTSMLNFSDQITAKNKCIIYTTLIDFQKRIAEVSRNIERDIHKSQEAIINGIGFFRKAVEYRLADLKMVNKFAALMHEYMHLAHATHIPEIEMHFNQCLAEYEKALRISTSSHFFFDSPPELKNGGISVEGSRIFSGTVTQYDNTKNYAFIQTGDEGKRYFFHKGALQSLDSWEFLENGVEVQFEIGQSKKGKAAINVRCSK